jgi:hypothetical protein
MVHLEDLSRADAKAREARNHASCIRCLGEVDTADLVWFVQCGAGSLCGNQASGREPLLLLLALCQICNAQQGCVHSPLTTSGAPDLRVSTGDAPLRADLGSHLEFLERIVRAADEAAPLAPPPNAGRSSRTALAPAGAPAAAGGNWVGGRHAAWDEFVLPVPVGLIDT